MINPTAAGQRQLNTALDGMITFARIVLALIAALPGYSLACSCVVDLERSYEASQQVHIVRILATKGASDHPTLGYVTSATFEIAETLKGVDLPAPKEIYAQGMCSDGFEPQSLYLVALSATDALVSICTGSFSFPDSGLSTDPRVAVARRTLQGAK